MDRNLLLAFALSFGVLMLWTTLVEPRKPSPKPPAAESPAGNTPSSLPSTPSDTADAAIPPPPVPSIPQLEPVEPGESTPRAAPVLPPAQRIELERPLYRAVLDARGGGIRLWELTSYDTGPNEGHRPIVLTTGNAPLDSILLTDFQELGIGDLATAVFDVAEEGDGHVSFVFERDGVQVSKAYVFPEDGYEFELTVRVVNGSQRSIAPRFAITWPAAKRPGQDFREQSLAALHEGSVAQKPLKSFGKPGFFGGGDRELPLPREVDWAGIKTSYFVGALLPDSPAQASARFISTLPGEEGVVQVFFDPVDLPPGASAERVFRAFLGPKRPALLEQVGGGLEKSIDAGWALVAPLTRFFLWALRAMHSFIPNYGVAIIVLTILVRAVTTPLTMKQMRSMERMRALAPKLKELKEKHADDRQKQSEEMMRLYRQEGVNPLGGCFPMLLQLPVFIGLFWALRSSIELRQAPFVGWINDLSAPDTLFMIPNFDYPFRVLPLLMGASMVFQQRITPMQQMDPAQQRMMMVMMPAMMTVISWTFPSGLVLYWMVSNVLAVGHQLWIGRGVRHDPQPAKEAKAKKAKPSEAHPS